MVYRRRVQLEVLELIHSGQWVEDAAVSCGVPVRTAYRWWQESGGVKPPAPDPCASYRRLSIEERERIHAGI